MSPWDTEIEAAMAQFPLVPPRPRDGDLLPIPRELRRPTWPWAWASLQRPARFQPARILYTPFHGTGIAFVPGTVPPGRAAPAGPAPPRPSRTHLPHRAPAQPRGHRRLPGPPGRRPAAGRRSAPLQRPRRRPHRPRGAPRRRLGADDRQRPGRADPGLPVQLPGPAGRLVTTVVTSDFVAEVARRHGLQVMWTLTGFKYIAVCMDALAARSGRFAFGAEESFGMQLSDQPCGTRTGSWPRWWWGRWWGTTRPWAWAPSRRWRPCRRGWAPSATGW